MDKEDFISTLSKMSHTDIAEYIKTHGKKKEPESYGLPFYIRLPKREDDVEDMVVEKQKEV